MAKVAGLSVIAGFVCLVLAGVSRLFEFSPMTLGPWSFAWGAELLFLLAIAINTGAGHEHK